MTEECPPESDGLVHIADRVLEIARSDPGRTALIHAHHRPLIGPRYETFTYAELSRRAESLAVGLRNIGVGEGTLCSFMVPPCFDSLVLGVALWRVGAVTVGIEPHSHGLRRVARCLDKVGPEVFFGTTRAHAGRLAFGWGRRTVRTNVMVGPVAPKGMHTLDSLIRERVEEPQPARVAPEDPTVIAFTTGSTGDPKPTVLRQRNFSALISTVSRHWGLVDGTEVVDMPTFPMFWIIGLSAGGTVVVPPMDFTLHGPGDADPQRLIRTIKDCGVTSMFASPALLGNLANYAIDRNITLPTIRRIVAGGAEIQGPLFARVKSILSENGEMYSDYGATEALPVAEIACNTVLGETWRLTEEGSGVCVGAPLPGVDVRIVEIDDGIVTSWDHTSQLAAGKVGEIVARSPHISEDYYRSDRANVENKIPSDDGGASWHRIGDTGYLDDDGRLWICGRRSHRVVTDSGTVFPLQCEAIFNAHPAVRRSALVGVDYGATNVPVICIERHSDDQTSIAALEREILELAAKFKSTELIRKAVFFDKLPVDKRHNAKIDRPLLADEIAQAWNQSGTTTRPTVSSSRFGILE